MNIDGFHLHLNSMGEGKGIGTYFKSEKMFPKVDVAKPKAQISVFSSPELVLVNLYRSQGMDNRDLANELRILINTDNFTIICGDFNLCYIDDRNNEVTSMLEQAGFTQMVQEATHFKGGHIDHVYSNHNPEKFKVAISLYSPYYLCRDHDAICITITRIPSK